MSPEALHYIRHVAKTAVRDLSDAQARRIACMAAEDIPLVLASDVYDRCHHDGFGFLRREIHRICCLRAGVVAA
jgi:hypothetical protein